MPQPVTSTTLRLDVGARETGVVLQRPGVADERFALPIGLSTLWPMGGADGGPSPWAIEHAIQVVEDQIEGLHPRVPPGARLWVARGAVAPLRRDGAIQGVDHEAISLATVEQWYQALAARAVGAPSARGTGFDDPTGDALVLILREFMHHLGFDAVHLAV